MACLAWGGERGRGVGGSDWNGEKSSAPPRGFQVSAYLRQEAVYLLEVKWQAPSASGQLLWQGNPWQKGRPHREPPFPTWPPTADSGLRWSDLKSILAVLHYQHPLQSHMINDGLFPHFCF